MLQTYKMVFVFQSDATTPCCSWQTTDFWRVISFTLFFAVRKHNVTMVFIG